MMNRFGKMSIADLTDILWWVLQQDNKNNVMFEALQKEMQTRVSAMRDTELLMFLGCFTENSTEFSVKLLKAVLKVIDQKLTKFHTKTLVGIVWSFSRLNLQADEQVEVRIINWIFKHFEQLRVS